MCLLIFNRLSYHFRNIFNSINSGYPAIGSPKSDNKFNTACNDFYNETDKMKINQSKCSYKIIIYIFLENTKYVIHTKKNVMLYNLT